MRGKGKALQKSRNRKEAERQRQSRKLVCTSVDMIGEKGLITTVDKDVAQIWLRQSARMLGRYGGQCMLDSTGVSSEARQLKDCAPLQQNAFVL
jgi:hypothetical protein